LRIIEWKRCHPERPQGVEGSAVAFRIVYQGTTLQLAEKLVRPVGLGFDLGIGCKESIGPSGPGRIHPEPHGVSGHDFNSLPLAQSQGAINAAKMIAGFSPGSLSKWLAAPQVRSAHDGTIQWLGRQSEPIESILQIISIFSRTIKGEEKPLCQSSHQQRPNLSDSSKVYTPQKGVPTPLRLCNCETVKLPSRKRECTPPPLFIFDFHKILADFMGNI